MHPNRSYCEACGLYFPEVDHVCPNTNKSDGVWTSAIPRPDLNLLHHSLRMLHQHPTTTDEERREIEGLADRLWEESVSRNDCPSTSEYAVVYERPDGWWSAGRGFESSEDAQAAGEGHDWRGGCWAVAEASLLWHDDEYDSDRMPTGWDPRNLEPR